MNNNITVGDLAKKLANIVKAEALVDALKRLGIHVSNTLDVISSEQEQQVLSLLNADLDKPKDMLTKISLKRRSSVSQIKVKSASGANATVSVVRKNRRVIYLKEELNNNQINSEKRIIEGTYIKIGIKITY